MKKYKIIILIAAISSTVVSCKKFLDLKPISSPTDETFYVDAKGLQGGLVSCYDALQSDSVYGANFLSLAEIRGDNVQDNDQGGNGGVRYQIESFAERSDNTIVSDSWLGMYRAIYRCNIVLARAPAITMDATQKKQITGQAQFLRALCYFNGTRLWGKLPLITKPQSSDEARLNQRADTSAIYTQVIADLTAAIGSLPASWPDAQRGAVTSWAATALLGKVYMYQKNYAQAISTLQPVAAAIYAGTTLAIVPQTTTFPTGMKSSKDIIFSVQYLLGGLGESVNQNNRYRNQSGSNTITLPPALFEANDNRKALVAPTGNGARPGKFNGPQVNNETSMDMPVIRCADVLLLYAEALNEVGYGNAEAFKAINAVRTNAGITALTAVTTADQSAFRTAVYRERRLELALECDRWFDIVRTGQMPAVYPLVPDFRRVYPVPQLEIQNITDKTGWQNAGY